MEVLPSVLALSFAHKPMMELDEIFFFYQNGDALKLPLVKGTKGIC